MIDTQAQRFVPVINPAAIVNNASLVSILLDTKDYDYLTQLLHLGATDVALTALKLQETDNADGTGLTDIPGADFSLTTLPSATDDGHLFGIHVNLIDRKRYVKLVATVGNGTAGAFASALAVLSRARTVPSDAASRGLAGELTVIS